MLISKDYERLLKKKGIPLVVLGVREVGLSRQDTLYAIDLLENESIAILGGDVYFCRDSTTIEIACANWYCDPVPGDEQSEFLARSWKRAREYVKTFPDQQGLEPLFVLVVKK
ncbi:MAG TPA: Imm40 family immunity protein [Steroidobacteraceae bacterium]|nr:Imm40 family immunity protein [Steroidobacteraceae bacterium]